MSTDDQLLTSERHTGRAESHPMFVAFADDSVNESQQVQKFLVEKANFYRYLCR